VIAEGPASLEASEVPEPVSAVAAPVEKFFYGGQAVIEGVMMRGRNHYAVAVRMPRTGEIQVKTAPLTSTIYVHPFWKLPFVRGLALLAETVHVGMSSLIWSARMNATGMDIEIGKREVVMSVISAAVFGLLLFIGLPLLGASLLTRHGFSQFGGSGHGGSLWFAVVEGLIRVGVVLGYLGLIGLMPDVRRVFQYHGAEHKTINAYESEWPLDVEHVRRASLLHPRCGTGFLLVVVIIGLLLFSVVALFQPNWLWLIASRLIGIPVIAAVGFEWVRYMARHRDNPAVKLMLLPVLGTQRFTTREPSADQLEVAIAAFHAARAGEEAAAA
jgi:uncharacterized protein YqhQ